MQLLVDIGNTSFHFSFDKKMDASYYAYNKTDLVHILNNEEFKNVEKVFVSSVNSFKTDLFIKTYKSIYPNTPIEIFEYKKYEKTIQKLNYKIDNIKILGSDLLFDLLGSEESCLIADYGTASKFLLLDNNKRFIGGVIGPGLKLLNQSLFDSTELLNNVKIKIPNEMFNLDTKQAINSNTTYGETFKLLGYYNYLKNINKMDIKNLILSGGDGKIIANVLKEKFNFTSFKVDENLIFKGIVKMLDKEKKNE